MPVGVLVILHDGGDVRGFGIVFKADGSGCVIGDGLFVRVRCRYSLDDPLWHLVQWSAGTDGTGSLTCFGEIRDRCFGLAHLVLVLWTAELS